MPNKTNDLEVLENNLLFILVFSVLSLVVYENNTRI